jgi:hypothetical protein
VGNRRLELRGLLRGRGGMGSRDISRRDAETQRTRRKPISRKGAELAKSAIIFLSALTLAGKR